MLEAATRLVRLLKTPQHISVLAPLIKKEMLYHILCGRHGSQLVQIARGESRFHRVMNAVDWLRHNFDKPFSMEKLSRSVGMSASALHRHFKAAVFMTPLQYHKGLRLEEARKLMVAKGINASTASFKVGYASPQQFSREYRRLYGEPPAKDVGERRSTLITPGSSTMRTSNDR